MSADDELGGIEIPMTPEERAAFRLALDNPCTACGAALDTHFPGCVNGPGIRVWVPLGDSALGRLPDPHQGGAFSHGLGLDADALAKAFEDAGFTVRRGTPPKG
jgi:hypothetical protein